MRIVLDTNIVMSALLWRGTPYRLLQAVRQYPNIQLYSSTVLLEELTDVFARPAAGRQLAAIAKTARHVIADYIEAIELAEPTHVPTVSRDPDDDHVLACALAARADCIVSGDKDLLVLSRYEDIPIVTAAQAMQRIEAEKK